jgi:HSP20 family protein
LESARDGTAKGYLQGFITMKFLEKDKKYYLTVEVPGMRREDISVHIENDHLVISGRENSLEEEAGAGPVKEPSTDSFAHCLRLPRDADQEKMEVSFENGVMNIMLPCKDVQKIKNAAVNE